MHVERVEDAAVGSSRYCRVRTSLEGMAVMLGRGGRYGEQIKGQFHAMTQMRISELR